MITYKSGNLLEASDVNVLIHGCNIFCIMGGGIALSIKNKWPFVYNADRLTKPGDVNKLGTFSFAKVNNNLTVVNLYTQKAIGGGDVFEYEAFDKGLQKIKKHFGLNVNYGVPHFIGCGLAGGNWEKVTKILETHFKAEGNLLVYKYG